MFLSSLLEFHLSSPFQNRLVGTLIVAAVAIIFLPDVLDGKKQSYQSEFESIPPSPQVEAKSQGKSFPIEELASLPKEQVIVDEVALDDEAANDLAQMAKSEAAATTRQSQDQLTTKTATKPAPFDEQPKTKKSLFTQQEKIQQKLPAKATPSQAWVIQLGSFKHKKNVEVLVNKLKKHGYTAFTKPIKTKNGTLTKVFVGPELIKSSLAKKIPQLKTLTNVEGKVARFYPTK